MPDEPKTIVVCDSWSLNLDPESGDNFWFNDTYSISIWEKCLSFDTETSKLTEDDVWRAFIKFQLKNIFKICAICHQPEVDDTFKICCYCSNCIHEACSVEAQHENIIFKPGNAGFEKHMRICFSCAEKPYETSDKKSTQPIRLTSARKAIFRLLTLSDLPGKTTDGLRAILTRIQTQSRETENDMEEVKTLATNFFQSPFSLEVLEKKNFSNKGGIGVVAKKKIPKFTIIGVYPGYEDHLVGEHRKLGRPETKYSLMDLNCADYFNIVFPEFQGTFTPFINEPTPTELSNCAWIQEPHRQVGCLSVMTVREIDEGEELLIGYGPVYPRAYEYRYDAYAFHRVEGYNDPICYALWYWPTRLEKDARFLSYVAYSPTNDSYQEWEEEEH